MTLHNKTHRSLKAVSRMLMAGCAVLVVASCQTDNLRNDINDALKPIVFNNQITGVTEALTRSTYVELEKKVQDFAVWSVKTADKTTTTQANGTTITTYTDPTLIIGYKDDPNKVQTDIKGSYKVEWRENSAGTSTSNMADWEYVGLTNKEGKEQFIKYWDYSATSYRFFGVAPYKGVKSVQYNKVNTNEEYADVTIECDATTPTKIEETPYFSNLFFTNNTLEKGFYGNTVKMEFMKPFCQVEFRFINAYGDRLELRSKTIDGKQTQNVVWNATKEKWEGDETDIVLSNISFKPTENNANMYQKGTFTITYPIAGTSVAQTYTTTPPASGGIISALDTPDKTYTLMPMTGQKDYAVKLKRGKNNLSVNIPEQFMQWLPNRKYTYVLKFTTEDMQFIDIVEVGVTKWNVETAPSHTVYNW